ncbi:MAG: 2-oxoglutarate dehydrogenase, E2 component, dihydrolipoamide succinyltransferase [Bryobacterales bacterium]
MSEVLMPQMGESIVEGTITKWMKKVGDKVERDEPLFEISTDKVDSEVPAPIAGVLEKIYVEEGATVAINTKVARIGDGSGKDEDKDEDNEPEPAKADAKEESSPAKATAKEEPARDRGGEAKAEKTEKKSSPEPSANGDRIRSSPLVRKLAKENDIDLSQVEGTGQGGRISKKDVEAYLKHREEKPQAAKTAAAAPSGSTGKVVSDVFAAFRPAPEARFGDYSVEPLSTMRQRIAEHMVLTKRLAPHVSTVHQVDATKIADIRAKAKDKFLEQNGVKLTFLPFFLRAAAAALKAFPTVNASLDGTDVIFHRDINLGIAVALDWGLIVPVIRQADEKSILGLQRAVNDLAERARKKQLKPDDIQQGTFSVSNYGSFGSLFATPAINQPQAAILGLGAIHKAPVVIDDAIAIRSISYVTLSFDHRVIDGAIADKFMSHLKGVIEGWSESVL